MFYSILTSTGTNFLDFGEVNINSTRVRTFTIVNISPSKISLELDSATPEDLGLYTRIEPKLATTVTTPSAISVEAGAMGPTMTSEPNEPPLIDAEGSKVSQGRVTDKADLKERFLESLATDSTLPARKENKTWRTAQKRAQQGRHGPVTLIQNGETVSSRPKPTINLLAALKKGGKGRLTVQYGKKIAFKDRTLLRDFEYLDLATGSPVDLRKAPAKSKRQHQLDAIEGHGTSLRSRGSIRSKRMVGDGTKAAKDTWTLAQRLIERNDPHHTDDASSSTSLEPGGEVKRSPALTAKRKGVDPSLDPRDVSQLPLAELMAAVESQPDELSSFYLNNPQAEERHVRMEINLHKELQKAITNDRLRRCCIVEIEPGAEQQVIVVLCPNGSTRPHIAGNARKQDLRINFRLVEYDASLLSNTAFGQRDEHDGPIPLPIRELMVRTTLCRSIMELGQAHINLGFMEKGETKARKILIQNRSEWALRYRIRKSGSIVSGDIRLSSGRYGVIPGHGKREVDFVFTPSYIGQLQEKLVIENIADRDNDQTIQLKAQVRKLPNFVVEPTALALGELQPDETSEACSFSITNVTSKARKFVVGIDESDLRMPALDDPGWCAGDAVFDVAAATASEAPKPILTEAEEEEVEHISQKLKVAHRKGQTDKIQKYEERLNQLGVPIPKVAKSDNTSEQGEPMSAVSTIDGSVQETGSTQTEQSVGIEPASSSTESTSRLQKQGSTVTFSLDGHESLRIVVHVRLRFIPRTAAGAVTNAAMTADGKHDSSTTLLHCSSQQAALNDLAPRSPPSQPGSGTLSAGMLADETATQAVGLPSLSSQFSIPIHLHENKNKDETSTVTLTGTLEMDPSRPRRRQTDAAPFARRAGTVVFTGLRE